MVTTSKKGAGRRPAAAASGDGTGMPDRRDSQSTGGGVPRRALADGVVERRRARRRNDAAPQAGLAGPSLPLPAQPVEDHTPARLTAEEHYRLERRRRADRLTGDLMTLLAEAKAEYEAQINAPRPAGKGGRPRKKVAVVQDDDDL